MEYSEQTTARPLGRYQLSHELGRGGMAVVHLARQTDLDRWVALKELLVEPGSDPSLPRRFLRESRLASSLSHPNIVTVYDFFELDGRPYIAMEYVPGGSLRSRIGRLSFAQAAGVLEGILAGLGCAEAAGIVHRDLKPENVMVTRDGAVKIADFGIAKATGARVTSSFLTAHGTTLGTPHYMAPEQAMAQDVGPWTDLYSLGCMAYELVTGRVPFADTQAAVAVMMRQASEIPPTASTLNPAVDPRMSEWIAWLMSKAPDQRPQRAADAWDALEDIVLAVSGGRWRRDARLPEPPDGIVIPGPFTPPPTAAVPDEPPFTALENTVVTTLPPQRPVQTEIIEAARGGRAKWIAGVAALVACAGAGALMLAPHHQPPVARPTPTPQRTATAVADRTLKAGPVSVTVPGGWPTLTSPPTLPGLQATAAGSDADGIVLAGMVPHSAANPLLLPAALLERLKAAPKPDTVTLGARSAFEYQRLTAPGIARPVTVYSVPTSRGVAIVACLGPDTFDAACRKVAQSLKIDGPKVLPVTADPALQRRLDGAIRGFGSIGGARTRGAQATAAAKAAYTYARARGELAGFKPGPREQTALADLTHQLDITRLAYRDLASAARAGSEGSYRAATDRARGGEHGVEAALRALAAAGYRTAKFTPAAIPALRPAPVVQKPPAPVATPRPVKPSATPYVAPQPPQQPPSDPGPKPNPTPIPDQPDTSGGDF